MGIGNFIGNVPDEMSKSKFYGVELDSVSGRIGKLLYPESEVQVKGLEETGFSNNFFDVAIGNVPFGEYKVNDREYNRNNFLIHDYFFAKSIDKVRNGGVIAFITSSVTMDKKDESVRRYLAARAEFLGAIRLPNDTFKGVAGTEVTSDIIFLKKRDSVLERDEDWIHLAEDENGLSYNKYFVDHPEQVLGSMREVSGRFGKTLTCEPIAFLGQENNMVSLKERIEIAGERISKYAKYEAIIPDELWQAAQVKLKAQAKKYEHVNKGKNMRTHLLSGIVKCPICGAGMFGNKSIKYKKDGTKYKDFYYYGCKHRLMNRGHKCTYNKQIREELLDDAVAEVIIKLVSNPKFASMMQEKINMKVDTSAIENEIDNYQKELRKSHSTKFKLIEEIDNLDVDDKHYKRRKTDLDDRLYRMYDKVEELEEQLIEAKAKKETIEAEKLTGDNIYKVLIYFDKLYKVMNDVERRQLIEALISEIQIYEEK